MAKIKLNGDTSGYIEISAPAVSGNNTLELGPGTKILTNLDNTFTGVSTFSSDVYLGNDIYLTDGSSGYEKVEVGANDIRVESKHVHSEFGVWTRSNSIGDRRNGMDGDGSDLRLYSNSTEKVRITSAGKIGIENTTPHRQLVVDGGGDISCFDTNGGIYFGASTGGFRNNGAIARAEQAGYHVSTSQVGDLVMAPEADKALIFSSGGSSTMYERLRLTTGGNIGINDSGPNFHLDVNGNVALREGQVLTWHDGSGNKAGDIYMDSSDNFVIRSTSSVAERLRIDSYGKMGINTNAPTARLDINHPHTEQGLVVRSRYGNIATAMVKFDGDPDTDGGDGNVLHIHGGSSRTDSEILHVNSTGQGTIFQIRGDGLTRVYKHLQLEHASNTAKIIFNEFGANDPKAQIEMDQVNGSNGQLRFYTQGNGTLSERMRISNAGYVTTPNQPAFSVRKNGNQTITHSNATKVQFNTEVFDVGGNFDSSTNFRFTAPVAGKYAFMGHLYIYESKQVEVHLYKNGSIYKRFSGPIGSGGNDNPNGMGFADIIDLAVNDYVECMGYQVRTDNGSANIYGGNNKETSFVGYLLG